MDLQPLQPVRAVALIREVDGALIPLLRGLNEGDWARPAVKDWTVADVAAHLLDGALRRLAISRDGHLVSPGNRDLSDYSELVAFLDELNASWVAAMRRLSPRLLTDLLERACPEMVDYLESLDDDGPAPLRVDWAGQDAEKAWMDIAREYTERWHHQQQIREAVGADGLDAPRLVRPLLETFMRALPKTYAGVDAPAGTTLRIRIADLPDLAWVLRRGKAGWELFGAATDTRGATAAISIPARATWRMFTKAISGMEAMQVAEVAGSEEIARPFFGTLAIMG